MQNNNNNNNNKKGACSITILEIEIENRWMNNALRA
jgi:hypothetical protein